MNTHGLLKANKAKIQNIVIGMYGLMAMKAAHQIIGYQFLVEVRGNGASIETNFICITF